MPPLGRDSARTRLLLRARGGRSAELMRRSGSGESQRPGGGPGVRRGRCTVAAPRAQSAGTHSPPGLPRSLADRFPVAGSRAARAQSHALGLGALYLGHLFHARLLFLWGEETDASLNKCRQSPAPCQSVLLRILSTLILESHPIRILVWIRGVAQIGTVHPAAFRGDLDGSLSLSDFGVWRTLYPTEPLFQGPAPSRFQQSSL